MAAVKKKHESGAAKNFITRTQAVRKLQVSLADFRRLCIFKGIYPREPRSKKKANKGSTKPVTFYYAKDIQYLLHEPVLQKFRDHKVFARKLSRAIARNELSDAKRLDDNRPRYKLDHLVKERYPTFLDALRDLDDPLSMLFLFALLPATDLISQKVTEHAERLCNQWMAYVAREQLLTKVFVSIKGVYYEANVKGQTIMWLVPFKFPQNMPSDIDFKIMLTFLEFYTTLVQFVLYKLYTDSGLVYPPEINKEKLKGVGGLSAYILKTKGLVEEKEQVVDDERANESDEEAEEKEAVKTPVIDMAKIQKANEKEDKREDVGDDEGEEENDKDSALDEFQTDGDVLAQPKPKEKVPGLFAGLTFYIGREVPLDILEFVVNAFDGKIISESALDELIDNEDLETSNQAKDALCKVDLSSVTHQICDRPAIPNRVAGRVYIQPQWIFDCINKKELVPVSDYVPGATLPPHLSPWGDEASGYDPTAFVRDEEAGEESEEEEEEGEEIEVAEGDEDVEEDEDEEALENQKELEQEVAGVKYSESKGKTAAKKAAKRKQDNVDEEKELRKMMMSNKQRKLYNKLQGSADSKKAREEELRKKRRKIEKVKGKLKQ